LRGRLHYVDEIGSAWVRQLTVPRSGDTVLLAEITLAEVAAALAAKHRLPGGITLLQRDRALSLFLQDCDTRFLLLPVDRPVLDRAVELTQKHRLRGYDAVQLASALVAGEVMHANSLPLPTFVAGDGYLLKAATAEKFPVENPLDHP
jgi:predicted nucleic acid-binding protein